MARNFSQQMRISKRQPKCFFFACPNDLPDDHHFLAEFRAIPNTRKVYANNNGIGCWARQASDVEAIAAAMLKIMHHWRFQVIYG